MEEKITCKQLTAMYLEKSVMLNGFINIEFDIYKNKGFHVNIEQAGKRKIEISTDIDTSVFELITILTRVERLLMLLDGYFVHLENITFCKSDIFTAEQLVPYAKNIIRQRLSYFSSADFCKDSIFKLIDFKKILTSELYSKWEILLDELGTVHQVYLYTISDSKMPIDIKCAFLIELAEPLAEIVKIHRRHFSSLHSQKKERALKECLKMLINEYGKEIFQKELSDCYDQFLRALVNSRVNIMHIKRKQKNPHLNGEQSVLYAQKLSLLYRKILFELLSIDVIQYQENLLYCVRALDDWNSISDKFLKSLKS